VSDSWRGLAALLAERLRHQAYQCEHWDYQGVLTGLTEEQWREQRKTHDRDDCAFCADTLAVERYDRKVAQEAARSKP
jgi:hypothetical protein